MSKENEIKQYIEKLRALEEMFSSDEDIDTKFVSELNDVLNQLTQDTVQGFESDVFVKEVRFKKLHPSAFTPTYSKPGDAGLDLTVTDFKINEHGDTIEYGFGIAVEIPRGYVGLVFPRSSVRKLSLSLTNCVGVIDSGYRGEIVATFRKTRDHVTTEQRYGLGDRAAQLIIIPYPTIKLVEVDELSDTERGDGGFGHTGK